MKTNELPEGWVWTTLGEINLREAKGIDPGKTPEKTFELWSVPSFDDQAPEIIQGKEIKSGKQAVEPGDVLICKINPRINRVWLVGEKGEHEQIGSTEWIIIKPVANVLPEYLLYYCRSDAFRKLMNSEVSGVGGSLTRARPKLVMQYEIPLPPLAEQRRIVAKLDALMAQLDSSRERLERVPALLKRFRQAVLAAAVSGRLTEAWRAQQPEGGETAADLLARIRAERRTQWEAKQQAKRGNQLSLSDAWKQKYEEPAEPDTEDLPELPEGWQWASFDTIAAVKSNLVAPSLYPDLPLVAPDNIEKETGRLLGFPTVFESAAISPKHYFYPGQIVYSKIRPYLSKLVIVDFEGLCSADMYPIEGAIDTVYLFRYMLSSSFLAFVSGSGSRSVLPKINQEELGVIPVPVPPLAEQHEIVRQVNHYFELADALEARLEQATALVEQLPQALLAKAFRGELVLQASTDEPAAALLARLRADAGAAPTKGKRGPKAQAAPLFE